MDVNLQFKSKLDLMSIICFMLMIFISGFFGGMFVINKFTINDIQFGNMTLLLTFTSLLLSIAPLYFIIVKYKIEKNENMFDKNKKQ